MQDTGRQFHIHCVEGDVGRYVILPGDPGRCEAIAALFDNAHHVSQNREYNIYTGELLGEKVSVCSTGIGGPSAAMFVVAAARGCRCGSCFHVIWNQEREAAGLDQTMSEDTSASVRVSVDALKLLIEQDRNR